MDLNKCALYHRVSTPSQNATLAHNELLRAAEARGLEVVLDIEEVGSGANSNRPGLKKLLKAAWAGHFNTVLCWKVDRFGRSTADLLANVDHLNRANVTFEAISQGLVVRPNGNPVNFLIFSVLASVAQFELTLSVDRILVASKSRKTVVVGVGLRRTST